MMYDPIYMIFGTNKTIEIVNKSLIAREWNSRQVQMQRAWENILVYENILLHDCDCNMTTFCVKMQKKYTLRRFNSINVN